MAKWGKVDIKQLKKLESKLEALADADFDKALHNTANKIAQILLNKVKKRTPVGAKPTLDGDDAEEIYAKYWSDYVGGELRDSWYAEVEKVADGYTVLVHLPVEYASYVEYGHRQTPGRYVPALGKTLKASWVDGKFMMTISVEELRQLLPGMLGKAVEQALKGAFYAK